MIIRKIIKKLYCLYKLELYRLIWMIKKSNINDLCQSEDYKVILRKV